MLDVIIKLGESVFQSRDVRGAVCSGDLELDKSARGVSFCGRFSRWFDDRLIELELPLDEAGKDHNRR